MQLSRLSKCTSTIAYNIFHQVPVPQQNSRVYLSLDIMIGHVACGLAVGFVWYGCASLRPPSPKTCGSPGGPLVTSRRVKLHDGRHLAYKERGISKEKAKHKIIVAHAFADSKDFHLPISEETLKELQIYVLQFDRAGYGESDPNPKRSVKSEAFDVEQVADKLLLGPKFSLISISLGAYVAYACLKYIPHRLSGVALVVPLVNYWWPCFPATLSCSAWRRLPARDRWTLGVAHYAPWLLYWWMTQRWIPSLSALGGRAHDVLSPSDLEIMAKAPAQDQGKPVQQGVHESLYRDLMVGFGDWGFDPTDICDPSVDNCVHIWQGYQDKMFSFELNRFVHERLPWIRYHEGSSRSPVLCPCQRGLQVSLSLCFAETKALKGCVMAGPATRKISAASARAHTRKSNNTGRNYFNLTSNMIARVAVGVLVGCLGYAYFAIRPVPPKICGTPGGPPVTSPRVKLDNGRHLAYKERGVAKEEARYKIIIAHGFDDSKDFNINLSDELLKELGVYILSYDRAGYGESDPNSARSVESEAFDIQELADKLGLGPKFYVIGISTGAYLAYSCLKYIPHSLSGVALVVPLVNYWWKCLPAKLSKEALARLPVPEQWTFRVAHYAPWLFNWWMTQKWFTNLSVMQGKLDVVLSRSDLEIIKQLSESPKEGQSSYQEKVRQQGVHESLHRDIMVGFGKWEFDPMDISNPFPNNDGSVHIWQGYEDKYIPYKVNRYLSQQLPWIQYHEVPDAGHLLIYNATLCEAVFRALLPSQ